MGVEFLQDGKMQVYRTHDVEMLKDIKQGKWSLGKIQRKAEALFEAAFVAKENSPLPEKPDIDKINKLLVDMYCQHFNIGGINETKIN